MNVGLFKYKKIISNTYELIKNQRNDCLHQLSTKLVKEYDVICVEHLDLQEMSQVNFLKKSNKISLPNKEYGVSIGYKMILSEEMTIDDAINDSLNMINKNKGK